MPYIRYKPDFSLYETFSRDRVESAARWLKKFKFKMRGYASKNGQILAKEYLKVIKILLSRDAIIWAETIGEMASLLDLPQPI